jgi:uncharacterized protein (TIGR00725 family)
LPINQRENMAMSSEILKRQTTIAVIGDGSLAPGDSRVELARELGRRIVDQGWVLMSGGLGGVMEAAGRGARESSHWRPGANVGLLPGHLAAAANPYVDIAIPTGLDVARNSLVAHADALVAVGGGAGTLSEMALAWQLQRLVVAMEGVGWAGRLAGERLDQKQRFPLIPDDRIWAAKTPKDAIELLCKWLPSYQPSYVGIGGRPV